MNSIDESSSGSVKHLPLSALSVALVLTCSFIWGGQAIAAKLAVHSVPPLVVMAFRFTLALPVLLLTARFYRLPLRINKNQLMLIAGNALLVTIQVGLFLLGTASTSSIRSTVIVNTFPLFAAVFCHFLTDDAPIRRGQLAGMLTAFAGLAVAMLPQLSGDRPASLTGDTIVLTSAIIVGFKIAYLRRILSALSPIQVAVWASLIGAPLCILLSFALYDVTSIEISTSAAVAIAFQGIMVSGFAVLIWTYLLSQHAVNNLTVFRMATPPLGVFLGWLILSEELSWPLLIGCVLIVLGIWAVNRSVSRKITESNIPA